MNLPRTRTFWAVGLGHFVNDVFMGMGPVVLAFLSVSVLPMTNTQIGLTISASQLAGALSQPGFGLAADRNGGRFLGAGGVAFTVSLLLLSLVFAQTGYFWLMFIPFVARGLGSGAFHPVGAMHASDSEPTRAATNLSYFFLLGQTGLAMGPAVAGMLLDAANPGYSAMFTTPFAALNVDAFIRESSVFPVYFLGLIALPAVWMMTTVLPSAAMHRANRQPATKAQESRAAGGGIPWRAFAVLGVLVALRSLAQPGSVTFIPVLFQQKGWSPAEYGTITSLFWIGSGIAGVFFGNLADRFDRRHVVFASLALAAPAFFFLPLANGAAALLLAVGAGALSGGSHSIIVVLAQELIPSAKGFASGAILGFIFGMGALGSVLIGGLADVIGLGTTFQLVAVGIIGAGLLALFLPGRRDTKSDEVEAESVTSPA